MGIGIGGMGVLLTKYYNGQKFFGGKFLINTEHRHKKHLSLILMVSTQLF